MTGPHDQLKSLRGLVGASLPTACPAGFRKHEKQLLCATEESLAQGRCLPALVGTWEEKSLGIFSSEIAWLDMECSTESGLRSPASLQ